MLRGVDLHHRPLGYDPSEITPSPPRKTLINFLDILLFELQTRPSRLI